MNNTWCINNEYIYLVCELDLRKKIKSRHHLDVSALYAPLNNIILHFGLGFIVDFISVPVTSAFTSATSLIIIGSQLKNLIGIEYSSKGFIDSIHMLIVRLEESVYWDAILAVGCCIFLLLLRVSVC